MCKKVGLIVLIVVLFLFLCGGCSTTVFLSNRYSPEIPKKDPFSFDLPTVTVQGSLGYPSEYIPAMAICAESPETNEVSCTYEMIENDDYQYDLGYELELTPGEYYIYAVEIDQNNEQINNYRAYYSEFVDCGMDFSCESHEPILVVVDEADEKIESIDPIDWYSPV